VVTRIYESSYRRTWTMRRSLNKLSAEDPLSRPLKWTPDFVNPRIYTTPAAGESSAHAIRTRLTGAGRGRRVRCVQPMQPDAAGCACCRARCGPCGLVPRVASGARRERRGEKWAPGIIFAHKESLTVHLTILSYARPHTPGGGRRRTRATIVISHKIVIVIVPVPRVASLCAGEPATPETADPGAGHRHPGDRGCGARRRERTRALQLHPLHTSF
jgi:hypothetical protein